MTFVFLSFFAIFYAINLLVSERIYIGY